MNVTCVRKHRAPKGALRHAELRIQTNGRLGSQKAPSAKRCIKTPRLRSARWPLSSVRKHRAPKGALRPWALEAFAEGRDIYVRKHRAPKGALRLTSFTGTQYQPSLSQKAPSAKRCIKTPDRPILQGQTWFVRKHRAPKGALRPVFLLVGGEELRHVRKHRAPKGALRLRKRALLHATPPRSESTERQKVH